jgi:hypothetical protein
MALDPFRIASARPPDTLAERDVLAET